jgi:hypothetical protein
MKRVAFGEPDIVFKDMLQELLIWAADSSGPSLRVLLRAGAGQVPLSKVYTRVKAPTVW